jgi:hypothetical protein
MSDLTVEAFAVLRTPAAGAALSLSIGFALAFILRRKQRAIQAGLLTAVTIACFIYFAHMALGVFDPYLSSRPLAEAIKQRLAPGDLVVINGEYQGGSSIGFYLPQKVLILNGLMTGLQFGSTFPDAPPVFIGDGDIAQLWSGERRVFLFTHDRELEKLRSVIKGEMFRLAAAGEKSIYSNKP